MENTAKNIEALEDLFYDKLDSRFKLSDYYKVNNKVYWIRSYGDFEDLHSFEEFAKNPAEYKFGRICTDEEIADIEYEELLEDYTNIVESKYEGPGFYVVELKWGESEPVYFESIEEYKESNAFDEYQDKIDEMKFFEKDWDLDGLSYEEIDNIANKFANDVVSVEPNTIFEISDSSKSEATYLTLQNNNFKGTVRFAFHSCKNPRSNNSTDYSVDLRGNNREINIQFALNAVLRDIAEEKDAEDF